MSPAHAFVLFFTICPAGAAPCEEGFLLAPSCQVAEAHIRRGVRPGQRLFLTGCERRA